MPTFSLRRFSPLLIALCFLPCLFMGQAQSQSLYTDNFDTDTVGSLAPKFVNKGSATFTVNTVGAVSAPNAFGEVSVTDGDQAIMTGQAARVGMTVQFSQVVRFSGGANQNNMALILASDAAGNNGYLINFNWGSHVFSIYKESAGSFTQSGFTGSTGAAFSQFSDGSKVWLKADYDGINTIRYKIWQYGLAEPGAWLATCVDGSTPYTAATYMALRTGISGGPAAPQADDLYFGASGTSWTTPDSPGAGVTYLATNALVHYSPYNWHVSSASANEMETNNSGASFTLNESGATSMVLAFDTTGLTASPALRYRVDSQLPTNTTVTSSATITLPDTGAHTITVTLPFFPQSTDRWVTPVDVVRLVSVTTPSGGSLSAVSGLPSGKLLVYSDSRGEGAGALGDADLAFPALLAQSFGYETGNRSFASLGWQTVNATGSQAGYIVPLFTVGSDINSSWNKYDSTHSLLSAGLYSPAPAMIIDLMGINSARDAESDASVTASVSGLLAAQRAAAGASCRIVLCYDFAGSKRSAILAGFNSYQGATPDTKCYLADAGTIAGLNDAGASYLSSDGAHPNAQGHAITAAKLAQAIQSKLTLTTGTKRRIQ